MQLIQHDIERNCRESDIYNAVLQLDNSQILELGCGKAEITRDIATQGHNRRITAMEVDELQHQLNLHTEGLPNVSFLPGAAEAIPLPDASQDLVLMFKSLHHVPVDSLDRAMAEIRRVLRPGGQAYISEPLYLGELNDIIRLFHDEQRVRQAAFAALQKSVADGLFLLREEIFFNTNVHFEDFADFEDKLIKVTHSEHRLDAATLAEVQRRFDRHVASSGADFAQPMRVDLLQAGA